MEEREDMVEARRDMHNYILARYQSASRPSGRVHVTLFAPSSRFSDASFSEGRISTAPHPNMPPMRQNKGNRSLRTGHGSNLTCSQPKMPPRSNLEASSTHGLGAYNWAYVLFRYFGTVAFPRLPVHIHVGSALHFAFRPRQPLWTSQRPRRSAQCPSFLSGPRWKRWKRWRSTLIVGSGTRKSTPSGTSLNPGLNQGVSDGPCVLEQPKWKPKIGQVAQRSREDSSQTLPHQCPNCSWSRPQGKRGER